MAMISLQMQVRLGEHIGCHFLGRAVRYRKAEFGIRSSGLYIRVRVRFNAGIDADQNVLHDPARSRFALNEIGFGMCVNNDHTDATIERLTDLVRQFIIAVKRHFFRRKTRLQGSI